MVHKFKATLSDICTLHLLMVTKLTSHKITATNEIVDCSIFKPYDNMFNFYINY